MIADVAIRLAKLADATEIAEISRDYIEHGLPWCWVPKRVIRAIRDCDTNVAVVGERGNINAFGIMSYADEYAHLLLLGVRPGCRKRGVGSAVLHWLEDVARVMGVRRIRVESRWDNNKARNFYCVQGYHERAIKRGMYCGMVDGVRMEKWLD